MLIIVKQSSPYNHLIKNPIIMTNIMLLLTIIIQLIHIFMNIIIKFTHYLIMLIKYTRWNTHKIIMTIYVCVNMIVVM